MILKHHLISIITHKKTRVNTTKYDKDAKKYLIKGKFVQ